VHDPEKWEPVAKPASAGEARSDQIMHERKSVQGGLNHASQNE
jgi:hypothetical protein